jgi:hypothetical protein
MRASLDENREHLQDLGDPETMRGAWS